MPLLLRELDGLGEAVAPFADEEAVGAYLAARRRVYREHPEYRALRDVVVEGVVEELADRRVVAAHRLLHSADGADHVRLVDHVGPAAPDEEVLRVVGHADHLVGDDLPGRDDEVVLLVHYEPVHLDGHRVLPEPLGDLLHRVGGHFPEAHDVGAPVVDDHLRVRDVAEHRLPLRFGDRHVRPERGEDVDVGALRRQQAVEHLGDEARVRVEAREVWRDHERVAHSAPARFPVRKGLLQQLCDFVVG